MIYGRLQSENAYYFLPCSIQPQIRRWTTAKLLWATGVSHLRREKSEKIEWRRGHRRGPWCVHSPRWCGLARPCRKRWTAENCCGLLASAPWNKKSGKIEWRRGDGRGPWCVRSPKWCGFARPRRRRWTAENCCGLLALVPWGEKSGKNPVTTLRQTGTLVRLFSWVMWPGPPT